MHKLLLHDGWTVRATGDADNLPPEMHRALFDATVPGCVHTDLLAARAIPDPYHGLTELELQWIGDVDWEYRTRFDVPGGLLSSPEVELVCEGLDTIAEIELNGRPVGQADNMHHPHRFDVGQMLRPRDNELVVTFRSAVEYARTMERRAGGELPHVMKHPFNFIRKMACNFGWDWGPTLVTCGIWKPIYLLGWHEARIAAVRPMVTTATDSLAVVDVHVDLHRVVAPQAGALSLDASLRGPDGTEVARQTVAVAGQDSQVVTLEVAHPQLWHPRGYGQQPLYTLHMAVRDAAGTELDAWHGRVGLRTVRLNSDADEIGSQMVLEVNGKAIFCKGANWIPDDCFPARVDDARYRRRIEQACDANMNMLRVWGGGIYETDAFYDICDELGVLVWQDFLFACAAYPEHSPHWEQVEAEARYNVARLSSHPSLVLWNGCNENIWGWFDWGWQAKLGERSWGLRYYLELLPAVVAELDPTRPYWPASPFSGSMDIHPLDDRHGNKHIWGIWWGGDYPDYRQHTPRFASEFGFQGAATFATWREAIPASQLRALSPSLLQHQKCPDGQQILHKHLSNHFQTSQELFHSTGRFDDWLYLTQLNQARALQLGVEWFRSRQPVCMGILYWQINDCWPVTSWSCIDGAGRPKPLWYATRRFYAPRLLTIQPAPDGRLECCAHNDTDEPWQEPLTITRMDFAGQALAAIETDLRVGPRGCARVDAIGPALQTPGNPSAELLVAQAGMQRATWFFEPDKDLDYPDPQFQSYLSPDGGELTLVAGTLLRDLAVFVDRLDPGATISDQLVTLLPGESVTFRLQSSKPLTLEALTSPPVLQCANRFGRQP